MKLKTAIVLASILCLASWASADPLLQLYVEGATYAGDDTWTLGPTSDPIRLWVIGNVSTPSGKGTIFDVKLAVAYATGLNPTISLTPATTAGGDYAFIADPSTPVVPTFLQTVTDGSIPKMGDGTAIPSGGVFGPGTSWSEYSLGDLAMHDSPVGDFITTFPSTLTQNAGQINVYEISISGVPDGTSVYFDAYDHYVSSQNKAHYVVVPGSHDAGITVPVPGAALLGLLGFSLIGWLKRRFE